MTNGTGKKKSDVSVVGRHRVGKKPALVTGDVAGMAVATGPDGGLVFFRLESFGRYCYRRLRNMTMAPSLRKNCTRNESYREWVCHGSGIARSAIKVCALSTFDVMGLHVLQLK